MKVRGTQYQSVQSNFAFQSQLTLRNYKITNHLYYTASCTMTNNI